eukprot:SAG11_NODE_4184_length_2023_cov_32.619023_1_plen_140_part_00
MDTLQQIEKLRDEVRLNQFACALRSLAVGCLGTIHLLCLQINEHRAAAKAAAAPHNKKVKACQSKMKNLKKKHMKQEQVQVCVWPVTTAPLHHCTTAPLHHCTTAPLHLCTTAPLHHCTTAPLHHCTTAPLHHCTHSGR